MKMYEVGGCVRDELLGVRSKDIDFTVVLEPHDFGMGARLDPFTVMKFNLVQMGFEIFLETPEFLTIRARFPRGHKNAGLTADFVLARKESDYTDGRRPDVVEPGTLIDDLARRDFTMNAIAKDGDGNFIDPFNGKTDLYLGLIKTVGEPWKRFGEDQLRMMRALRFAVTKGFKIGDAESLYIAKNIGMLRNVSAERVREETVKMFNADPKRTVEILTIYKAWEPMFDLGINFTPTLAKRVK